MCVVCKRRNLLKFQVLFALVRHFCVCFFFLLFVCFFPHFPSLSPLSLSIPFCFFLFGHSNMLHTFVRQETGTATPPTPPQVVAHVACYSHFSDCLSFCLSVACSLNSQICRTTVIQRGRGERERERERGVQAPRAQRHLSLTVCSTL